MANFLKRLALHRSLCETRVIITRLCSQAISKPEDFDLFANCTNNIIQKTVDKWEQKKNIQSNTTCSKNSVIKGANVQQIAALFQGAIDIEDYEQLKVLIRESAEFKTYPPLHVLIPALSICSQNGDKELIDISRSLCKKVELEKNSNFDHFMAEAIWIKGDVPKSLKLFESVYRKNAFLRRQIRLMLQYLIVHSESNRSEAILWNIIDVSKRLAKDFNDFYLLACLWQSCFLSEWYTDQCVAMDLLEKNNGFCKSITNRIPYVVQVSLKCHRTEVVYRLLEFLLKYEMRNQYGVVLIALLDYQFHCGDFFSCSEIIRWAANHDVNLPANQYVKFINLMLDKKNTTPLASTLPKKNVDRTMKLKF